VIRLSLARDMESVLLPEIEQSRRQGKAAKTPSVASSLSAQLRLELSLRVPHNNWHGAVDAAHTSLLPIGN
jgi:hypothetical protein